MRILVFTTLFPNRLQPNAAIFVKQRMFHFARLPGHEIRVVAPVPYCPSWVRMEPWSLYSRVPRVECMEGIRIHHPRYPLVPKVSMQWHFLSLLLSSVSTLRRIQKSFPFDLIDAHYIYPDGLAAVLLGKWFGKPVVLSARGSDVNQFKGFPTIRPMLRYALREAQEVISVCSALKQEMVDLGCPAQKITVVPNGVDADRFKAMDRHESRRILGLPRSSRVVLSVGSLIPRKGFDLLINAFHRLVERYPDAVLYILGEGPQKAFLKDLIKENELESRVSLVGEVPNNALARWYSAADVFCLASSREGWANVIMEALACGCPVVATRVYGAPEILTTPEVGLLVDRTTKAIASGLDEALFRVWDRDRIRRHVLARDWFVVAREVAEVFRKTVQKQVMQRR